MSVRMSIYNALRNYSGSEIDSCKVLLNVICIELGLQDQTREPS